MEPPSRPPTAAERKQSTSAPAVDRRALEVQEARRVVHPIAEEAAMLYANGRTADARTLLEGGVKLNLGKAGDHVWQLLFDLYLLLGEKDAFENLALGYVVKFEKSPPSWSPIQAIKRTSGAGGPAVMVFNSKLNATSSVQAEQAMRLAQRNKRIRLDLSRVQDVDEAGCGVLLALLNDLKQAEVEVSVPGAAAFNTTLATRVESGRKEHRDIWLLMMRLFQTLGQQEAFEETALQYAITFEESPPSWETIAAAPAETKEAAATGDEGYVIQGEIIGGGSEAYAGLPGYAAPLTEVLIDMSSLKRMDFVSAGMLLNALSAMEVQGKVARLKGVNALVATLFGILGIDQFAAIERRK